MSELVWTTVFLILTVIAAIAMLISPSLTLLAALNICVISTWASLILLRINSDKGGE